MNIEDSNINPDPRDLTLLDPAPANEIPTWGIGSEFLLKPNVGNPWPNSWVKVIDLKSGWVRYVFVLADYPDCEDATRYSLPVEKFLSIYALKEKTA